MLVKEFHEKKR